jgi:hypothetical protein
MSARGAGLRERIMAHHHAGGDMNARVVHAVVGGASSLSSVRVEIWRLRSKRLLPHREKATASVNIRLRHSAHEALTLAAEARGVTAGRLAKRLLELALADGLIDALLDGERP